jgi:hypothetical protein
MLSLISYCEVTRAETSFPQKRESSFTAHGEPVEPFILM